MTLIDQHARTFEYLRLSITNVCNFRCQYCLPDGAVTPHAQSYLSLTEIAHLIDAFGSLGIKKVRLTGGEPTLRRDFLEIVSLLKQSPYIEKIAVTTNGIRVNAHLAEWVDAGLNQINFSVDSLNPAQFQLITGQDKLQQVLTAVDQALAYPQLQVKVNTVLMKGVNDTLSQYLEWIKTRPLELRFIELMETELGCDFFEQYHQSGAMLETQLRALGWEQQAKKALSGPAKVFAHPEYQGKIGLILPYGADFCTSCNRLRVSAVGRFHLCLFGQQGEDLRDLLQSPAQKTALIERIIATLPQKREQHFLLQRDLGGTQSLSFIGG